MSKLKVYCSVHVLISTYWNVNFAVYCFPKSVNGVLISTYWNVNSAISLWHFIHFIVLISTYWNVNRDEVEAYAKAMGFNLNLLECKSVKSV